MHQTESFALISRETLRHLVQDLGKSDAEIAQMYGVTANTVNQKRRLMNLMNGQMTAEQLREAVQLGEAVKHLPLEGIEEVRQVVARYQDQTSLRI
ncbi:hypothetical protein [Alicyclobacillus acidiphilus]|uniref:hypothetical protein n=1 Tax=Alicyclobacillus acidiphilus TaxID=182455 RepID=UPI0008334DB6|nr:hypothetical protein [Alicyclobacillus acidiphilus]